MEINNYSFLQKTLKHLSLFLIYDILLYIGYTIIFIYTIYITILYTQY